MHIDTYNAEAWSLQLQGRKAWFMADPNVPLSDPTALCTVVQHANTLLYIPRSTMHGTLNLDLSLSIINNFFDGYSIADTEFADGDDGEDEAEAMDGTAHPPADGAAGGKRRVEDVQARSLRRSPGGAGSGAAAASAAANEAELEAELAALGEEPDDLGLDSLCVSGI